MKIGYYFMALIAFLFYGCFGVSRCWEYRDTKQSYSGPDTKYFTIINDTDKTYTNNALYSLEALKKKGVWKLYYGYPSYGEDIFLYRSINTIKPGKTITKNEKDETLKLTDESCSSYVYKDQLFLLSLDGGKKKVFFGVYHYRYDAVYGVGVDEEICEKKLARWDVPPIWQNKDLTITIQKDGKIKFSDPKIKEVKKITAYRSEEEVDLTTLPIISDCE